MIPTVDEQLVLEVLRRVEVLAGWLLAVTPTLEKSTMNTLIRCKGTRGKYNISFDARKHNVPRH